MTGNPVESFGSTLEDSIYIQAYVEDELTLSTDYIIKSLTKPLIRQDLMSISVNESFLPDGQLPKVYFLVQYRDEQAKVLITTWTRQEEAVILTTTDVLSYRVN